MYRQVTSVPSAARKAIEELERLAHAGDDLAHACLGLLRNGAPEDLVVAKAIALYAEQRDGLRKLLVKHVERTAPAAIVITCPKCGR